MVYPGSNSFAAAYGIEKAMEDIYQKGTTTALHDRMVLFGGVDDVVGLDKVREVEAHCHKDVLVEGGKAR
jgi:hypothetical protein